MKNIILNIVTIALPAIFLTFNIAGAEDRVRVFEMGESGFAIEFPMTSEEIAAADAIYSKVVAASKKSVGNMGKRVKVFEMGESGLTVEFRMTAAEITATAAENARLAALRSARPVISPENKLRIELAESGHIFEFPAAKIAVESGDLAISRKNPADITTSVQ